MFVSFGSFIFIDLDHCFDFILMLTMFFIFCELQMKLLSSGPCFSFHCCINLPSLFSPLSHVCAFLVKLSLFILSFVCFLFYFDSWLFLVCCL